MRDLAILSMHTSPLAQPGTGDGGGMNVYVRELGAALARSGVRCEVFTRADDPSAPAIRPVEPGFRVHHVPAGPLGPVAKEDLPDLVDEWADGVRTRLVALAEAGRPVEAIHANYWLSGLAGHRLKHEFDIPLVSTFHTLDRVKAESSPEAISAADPARRTCAEAEIMGCSDVILASCTVEADQLVELYGAPRERIEIVAPGVDHAIFAPGDRHQARRAVGFPADDPVILFVGRIQPLKGLPVVVEALADLAGRDGRAAAATLVVVEVRAGRTDSPRSSGSTSSPPVTASRGGSAGSRRNPTRCSPPTSGPPTCAWCRAARSRSDSSPSRAACGIPVLASAVGGLTTIVDDGRTGSLLDPLDPAAWAGALARLLDAPDVAAATGGAAARRARGYTWARAGRVLRARTETLVLRERELVACR